MNKIALLCVAVLMTLLLVGCDTDAKITVISKSQYPIYSTINNISFTLGQNETRTFKFHVKDKNWIFGVDSKKVPVYLYGETFRLYDPETESYTRNTVVELDQGETRKLYCNPNAACLKILNNSEQNVEKITIIKHSTIQDHPIDITLSPVLAHGESYWTYITPVPQGESYYYTFLLTLSDGSVKLYGNTNTILRVDQQYYIELSDEQTTE